MTQIIQFNLASSDSGKITQPLTKSPSGPQKSRMFISQIAVSLGRARTTVLLTRGCCVALLAAAPAVSPAVAAQGFNYMSGANGSAPPTVFFTGKPAQPASLPQKANFRGQPASDDTRKIADWATSADDNHGMPFIIVDKINAKAFVFDRHGQLLGASRVLLGLARGDDSIAGIGTWKLSSIRPDERTTPAGRFVASLGHDSDGQDILWVDYADNIAMHRVITSNPTEHRLQRLATESPLARRISFGCINVPAKFYDNIIKPTFTRKAGIVYILPDTKSIHEVFAHMDTPKNTAP